MTGACHAPVYGRQGKNGGCQNDNYQQRPLYRILRPHRKIRRFGDGQSEQIAKFVLTMGGSNEQNRLRVRC